MEQLYFFYLGGAVEGANIEVHDIQFVAAETPEDAFPSLLERWWGKPELLHVDTYGAITWADGYDISLATEPDPSGKNLYFVNMGGYREGLFQELHDFGFFVADDPEAAKAKAKERLLDGAILKHRDNQVDVDDCLLLSDLVGLHIRLNPNADGRPDVPSFQGYLGLYDQVVERASGSGTSASD